MFTQAEIGKQAFNVSASAPILWNFLHSKAYGDSITTV